MPLRNAAFWLLFAVIARAAPGQALPPDLVAVLAKSPIDGPVAAWCRAEFKVGKPGAFAVARGGRYLALDADGRVTALGFHKGKADLSCYTRGEAEKLDRTIRQSETIEGKLAPRWNTTVVCGFLEDTLAECWQRNPEGGMFERVGGWTT